jgi:TubC N-terminal docking domain
MLIVSEFVLLPDGRLVRAELWARLVLLHARGLQLSTEGGDLVIRPRGHLTDAERDWLVQHKADVVSLLQPGLQAPLPAGWHDVHVLVGAVDELCAELDRVSREGERQRRRKVH